MRPALVSVGLLASVLCAGPGHAADALWNGVYAGANAGSLSSSVCSTWTGSGSGASSAAIASFYTPACASSGAFAGGFQIGDNFQIERFAWGVGLDLEFPRSSNPTQTYRYALPLPPTAPLGTYTFTGRESPNVLSIFSARFGYAGNEWQPYVRAGGVLAGGSQDASITYLPEGATRSTASFVGGRSFSSAGWAAGGGADFGLHGPWSISAEYLRVELGKGSSSTATCSGSVANCAAFTGISLDNSHKAFSANLVRISINYWFDYW